MSIKINKNLRVLVIGDIMLDHYIFGNCSRISPEAPVPIVEITNETFTLGGAGNVLENIQSLSSQADIIAVVGVDDHSEIVLAHLVKHNISPEGLVKDSDRCTTLKSRVLAVNHQLIRLDREITKPITPKIINSLLLILKKNISKYDVVLLSDYNKGLLADDFIKEIFNICRGANVKTILDPKGLNFKKYNGVNVIKPNKKEASLATNIVINDKKSLQLACEKIVEDTGCEQVVITMSEEGMALYDGAELVVIATKALNIIDVTGAGDTVLSSLGIALASGNSFQHACEFANHAAAVVVNKVGSSTVTLAEISERFFIEIN